MTMFNFSNASVVSSNKANLMVSLNKMAIEFISDYNGGLTTDDFINEIKNSWEGLSGYIKSCLDFDEVLNEASKNALSFINKTIRGTLYDDVYHNMPNLIYMTTVKFIGSVTSHNLSCVRDEDLDETLRSDLHALLYYSYLINFSFTKNQPK